MGGTTLTRKALEKGFSLEELRDVGLTGTRGGDYFERRLVFPLSDARGRILGFQARRLHDDDKAPKYVNTRESELFKKGDVVYGLNLARLDISHADRACVVEGNTDVIALRQAGFKPVVACMGTALTEHQLRELSRLTKRLWLAFDGDAAGASAALRGMELAVRQGFEVKIVALPPGIDPADDPSGFEARLAGARPYVLYRSQIEAQRAEDREAGRRAVEAFLNSVPNSLDRQAAWRWANDHFGMAIQIRGGGTAASRAAPSPRVVAAADKIERGALAGAIANRGSCRCSRESRPTTSTTRGTGRCASTWSTATRPRRDACACSPGLDAWGPEEEIDKATAETYLLRMTERQVQTELRQAPYERLPELTEKLARIRDTIEALGAPTTTTAPD